LAYVRNMTLALQDVFETIRKSQIKARENSLRTQLGLSVTASDIEVEKKLKKRKNPNFEIGEPMKYWEPQKSIRGKQPAKWGYTWTGPYRRICTDGPFYTILRRNRLFPADPQRLKRYNSKLKDPLSMTDTHISQETHLTVFENQSETPLQGDYIVACTGEFRVLPEDGHTALPYRIGIVKRAVHDKHYVIHWLGNELCDLDGPWLPGHIDNTTKLPHYTKLEKPTPGSRRHITSKANDDNPNIHLSQIVLWGFKCLKNGHLPIKVIRAITKCPTLKIT